MRRGWSSSVVGVMTMMQLCAVQLDGGATSSEPVIRLGYLTGSRRLPGNRLYSTPGRSISGAITLAVNEINANQQVPLRPSVRPSVCSSCLPQ